MPPVGAHSVRPPPKISNAFFQMFLTGQTLRGDASIVPCKYFLGAQQTIYDFSWRDKGIPPDSILQAGRVLQNVP